MSVAGIDAHTTYVMIAIVDRSGNSVSGPTRIPNAEADRLVRLLEEHTPVEVVVETCPSWPWLFDLLERPDIHLVFAHAKRLTAIADSTYKRGDVDAELPARMRFAGLIPEVHPKSIEQREQATLIRNRAGLVRLRTAAANRIHAHLFTAWDCTGAGGASSPGTAISGCAPRPVPCPVRPSPNSSGVCDTRNIRVIFGQVRGGDGGPVWASAQSRDRLFLARLMPWRVAGGGRNRLSKPVRGLTRWQIGGE